MEAPTRSGGRGCSDLYGRLPQLRVNGFLSLQKQSHFFGEPPEVRPSSTPALCLCMCACVNYGWAHVCVRVQWVGSLILCVCAHVCVCACACVRVRACVRVYALLSLQ